MLVFSLLSEVDIWVIPSMHLVVKAVGDITLTDSLRRRFLMVAECTEHFISIGVMKRLLHCIHEGDTLYRYEELSACK